MLRTETEVDEFLDRVPGLAVAANMAQTRCEEDEAARLKRPLCPLEIRRINEDRVMLKRTLCLLEMHRAHLVDLGYATEAASLSASDTRLYFDALADAVNAYMWGLIFEDEFLAKADALLKTFQSLGEKHETAKRIVESQRSGKLRGFDTDFIKRLVVTLST